MAKTKSAGRLLALAGLLLVALNLRTAVSSLSPIIPFVREDFELTNLSVAFLGMLPPLSFALSGLLAPWLTRRIGLEVALIALMLTVAIGHFARAISGNWSLLSFGTFLSLTGMGMGNVLLPVVVRKYFKEKIGAMTSLYLIVVSISALVPPLVAVPSSEAYGWRLSLGQWGLLALIAITPWAFEIGKSKSKEKQIKAEESLVQALPKLRIWKSKTALAMTVIFAVSSLNGYAMFAWLPQILIEITGSTPAETGILLSLFAGMGLPAALLMPLLAVRFSNQAPLVYLGGVLFFLGYGGLLFLPTLLTPLWVLLIGLGPLLFPLNLALFNIRSTSQETLLRISGFAQGFGYLTAALGPLVLGALRETSGNWNSSLWFLFLTGIPAILAGTVIAQKKTIDEELA